MSTQKIFLIRHGKPLVAREGLFTRGRASQYIADYDAADVEAFDRTLARVDIRQLQRVHCSTLQRAKDTARKLFGEQMPLVEDAVFREFERRILQLPLLHMPIRWWLVSSRALWLMGYNNRDIETFQEARARARAGAELLAREAQEQGQAVLVAHGFLNRFIRRALQQQGWQVVRKAGRGFLGVSELVK